MLRNLRNPLVLGLVLVLGLLLLVMVATDRSDGPTLVSHPNGVVEGAARVHRGDTVTIGGMFACLDKSGSVTITDIAAVRSTGVQVTGWALRPNPFWKAPDPAPPVGGQIMVARMSLARLLFPTSRVMDAKCVNPDQDGIGYEFAVQVKKTTSGEAVISAFTVTYTSDGDTRTYTFPLAVGLCTETCPDDLSI